jgi:opacity protein-like surface antigen
MRIRLLPCCGLAAACLVGSAATSTSQEPTGPPPPSSTRSGDGAAVHELLPDIGKIGAEVGVFGGASWNPYDVGPGFEAGGLIDLPLRRAPGGKLSYEIFLGLSLATSDPFTITNTLAYQLNLALGRTPAEAENGPLPVHGSVRTRLRLLHVSPFSLKYTITRLDHVRLRPYLNAGADVLVTITRQDPVDGGDPLIGGIVSQAPELAAKGTPTGQGNIDIAGHAAAGVEIRISAGQSLNLEYRFTAAEGKNARLQTLSAAVGFHW